MSLIAEVKRETNEERLTKAGVYLNYVPADKRELLNALNDREVELLIGLKRRFEGDLPVDPAMYQGSGEF